MRKLIPVIIAVLLTGAAMPAGAAVESYIVSYGSASAPLVVADAAYPPFTDFPTTINLPQFDPSQGTLTELFSNSPRRTLLALKCIIQRVHLNRYTGAYADNLSYKSRT